ncbi:MAG TPA: hypothetical protein VHB74_11415 [Devosia sp.]|nr:hypothetical protein [Devosia sp.]
MKLIGAITAAALIGLAALPALAQGLPPVKIAGVIASANGNELDVTQADGSKAAVTLGDKTFIGQTTAISINDVKPGSFVGTAAMPGSGGKLKGLELHVFPESMRGVGEGFSKWDAGPGSSMTNGTLSQVVGTTDKTITVTYKGGQQTVAISPDTPVVTLAPADRSALVAGAHTVIRGSKGADGKIVAGFVTVGKGDSRSEGPADSDAGADFKGGDVRFCGLGFVR